MNNYTFTLVGQSAVGKSKFCEYFKNCLPYKAFEHSDDVDFDLEFKYNDYTLRITDDKTIKADGLILFFDVSKPSSYDYLQEYINLDCAKILVGNKADLLEGDNPKWYYNNVIDLLNNKKINKYYDISAVSYYNIDKPFNSLIEILTV